VKRIAVPLLLALVVLLAGRGDGDAASGGTPPARSLARERAAPPEPGSPLVVILCYHDLSDAPGRKDYTIPPEEFRRHLRRLRESGWTFLSLTELIARRDRPEELPGKTVVITFDDAYRNFTEKALPILKEEKVKATLAVVSSFIDNGPAPDMPPLMTWRQIREAEESGFAEVASHTHDLHRYVVSNPYNDTAPAVVTRRYLNPEKRYEDREEYRNRIRADLRKSRAVLAERLGHDVPALAWPYGEHNAVANGVAREEGFSVTLGVEETDVRREDFARGHFPRVMVVRGMTVGGKGTAWLYPARPPVRAAQADLDAVYHPDPAVFRARVDRLVAKVRAAGANTVFLQALADPAGDGDYQEAYFMNHQVPVRADIWSMVAHKFLHAGIRVWIRAPVMNLSWEWDRHPEWRIPFRRKRGGPGPEPWYFRLSPDIPEAQRAAVDFFTDIAVYLPVDGVLFDDDAYMLEGERLRRNRSASPAAKSEVIRALVREAQAAVLAWRPKCAFGRNLYAPAAEQDGVHPKFSQDLSQYLSDYDLTVVMAYARMEGHREDPAKWTRKLAARLERKAKGHVRREGGLVPVMLKFQAYDWEEEEWIPAGETSGEIRAAMEENIFHVGVYPVLPEEGELPEGILKGIPTRSERDAKP
jgi:biofilm PGA synthesis lipoprotein PgaB